MQFFDESRTAGVVHCRSLGYTDHTTKTDEFDILYFPRPHDPLSLPPPR